MKNLTITLLIATLLAGAAQAQRSVPGRESLSDFRPLGEYRLWTFIQRDSVLGTVTSTVDRETEIDGIEGWVLTERLELDFTKTDGENRFEIQGEHYVAEDGRYLGDDLRLNINDQLGAIELERDDDVIEGQVSRGERSQDVSVPVSPGRFAFDPYMADQLEIFFALRGLTVGEVIEDSVFVPRDLMTVPIRAQVGEFSWVQLYKGVFDSVVTVYLEQPVPAELSINRNLHLRKINYRMQDMRVYLDIVRQQPRSPAPSLSFGLILRMIPKYVAFAIIGLIGLFLYAGSAIRRGKLWIALLLGGVAFLVVALVQLPLQNYIFATLYRPRLEAGSLALPWALLAVLPAGLIQEGLKLLGIYAVDRMRRITAYQGMAVGAAVGAGLGIVEACYLDTVVADTALFTWAFLQRVILILFHATTGALIGRAFLVGRNLLWGVVGLTVLLNMVLRLFPVMVQAQWMDAGLVNIAGGFLVVILMLWAVMWQRRLA